MKRVGLIIACAALLASLDVACGAVVPGLFNTGVDDAGAPLPPGSPDSHYILTGPLANAAVVDRHVSPTAKYTWVNLPPGAAWIGPAQSPMRCPPGLYTYTLRFDLTGCDPAAVTLSGEFSSDDGGKIFLNGQNTGYPNGVIKYRGLIPFTLGHGFVAGVNTLEFCVTNIPARGPNPTGLLVANLNLTGKGIPANGNLTTTISPSPPVASPTVYVTTPAPVALASDPAFGNALPSDVGLTYHIEASSDLVHWTPSTNVSLFFRDLDSTNYSQRYYRFMAK